MASSQTNEAVCFRDESGAPIIELPHLLDPQISVSQKEYLELKWEVGVLKSLHKRSVSREQKLKETIKEKDAEIRALKKRLYGKSSEKKKSKKSEKASSESSPNNPRGQQPGSQGHGRTKRPDLPEKVDENNFSEIPICEKCGKPYIDDGSDDEEIYEVEVQAYKRRRKNQRVKKGCTCKNGAHVITAPKALKPIPKSPYGASVWESILINKFLHCQPTHRFLNELSHLGLPISQGTVTGGLKILQALFVPIYEALQEQQIMEERLFHNDETRWKVFEHIEGKAGNLWWLWVSRSESVVFFQIAQSRGASVPVEYFEPAKERQVELIVICDRYSAYKSLAKQLPFITLAFCWAHVRRDFLDAAQKHPDLEEWALDDWVAEIGELYHINNQRCREFDGKLPLQWQSASFKEHHGQLMEKMDAMVKTRDQFLEANDPDDPDLDLLSKMKAKVLTSLKNHWEGLTVFVDHPQVPMDNNKGEQAIRNPVTGRKNFYGSGSQWSSTLAAMMFSIFQTLGLWDLNPRHWLRSYLMACAQNGGQAPDTLTPFLPWQMDDERRELLSKPPPSNPDTS